MTRPDPRFVVLGSLNLDLVTSVDRFPVPGETLAGRAFAIFPGGKGANQAVALGRLGCSVSMLGAIGSDVLGATYLQTLKDAGVGSEVEVVTGSTGTASILVDRAGENNIVVVAGANGRIDQDWVARHAESIKSADVLLLQLKIPLTGVEAALDIAASRSRLVILDPAPARQLPESWFPKISVITPNETEASILTGCDTTEHGLAQAGRTMKAWGVQEVIIKAGRRGAYWIRPEGPMLIPGFSVNTVDTVAAGDSFNAGLACALAEGQDYPGAIRFANAVAALSTTVAGAQTGMPNRVEVERLLRSGVRGEGAAEIS